LKNVGSCMMRDVDDLTTPLVISPLGFGVLDDCASARP
jgi:hypothetical protein